MMKDDDFKLLRGFDDGQTDRLTDIGGYRVAFASEKKLYTEGGFLFVKSWIFTMKEQILTIHWR